MKCPQCKLINDPDAQRCDCGYDFETQSVKQSYLTESAKPAASPLRRVGCLLMPLGIFGGGLARQAGRASSDLPALGLGLLADLLALLFFAGLACFLIGLVRERRQRA